MVSQTKYPGTIAQTSSGVPYRNWTSLNNLKADDNTDARCNDIATKSGTSKQPGPLKATGFGFNIPSDARIDSIEVQYEHFKISHSSSTAHMNISAPTVDFVNTAAPAIKLYAPPTTRTKYGYKWNRSSTFAPTPAQVNSGLFGVTFNYPANTNSNPGDLALDYIRLVVNYTLPTYSIQMSTPNNSVLGDNVSFKIDLTNTNSINSNGNATVNLNILSGLSYVSYTGNGTYSNGVWNAKLAGTVATLTITFKATSTGYKTLRATEFSTSVYIQRGVTIYEPSYSLSSTLPESGTQGTNITYTVTVTVNPDYITNTNVNIPFPSGLGLVNATGNGTYNNGVWNVEFVNKKAVLTITASINSAGTITQTITHGTGDSQITVTNTLFAISADVTETFNMTVPFPQDTLEELEDGESYVVGVYCKVVDVNNREIFKGPKNYRLELVNDDEVIISNQVTQLGTWQLLTLTFTKKEEINPSLVFHGGYIGVFETDITVHFATELYVGLSSTFEGFTKSQKLFDNKTLLLENGDLSNVNLDSLEKTAEYIFSDINLAGLETADILLTGIGITGNILTTDNTTISSYISTDNFNSSKKSQIITADDSTFEIGGEFDTWGLFFDDLTNLGFVVEFVNNTNNPLNLALNNLMLVLYYHIDLTGGQPGFTVDGVHSSTFNIFLTELNLPGGVKNEVKSVDIEGADGELPIRSNIKPIDIKIEFSILADCTENSYAILERIAKYLENDRDITNKPILKSVVFDVKPDKKYYYVLEDLIDAKNDEGELECDTTFNIPSGTAESLVETVTGEYGENKGLTKVYPLITCISTGANELTIKESVSNLKFKINTLIPSGTILTLNTNTNTLTASNSVDYSSFVDINSDRIILNTLYDFSESEGCVVQEVRFKEQL